MTVSFRHALLPLALAASGCDPLSCEALNGRQDTEAMRTCVSSASFEGAHVDLPLADGSVLSADGPPLLATYWTFEDGVPLRGGTGGFADVDRAEAANEITGRVVATAGGRYALALSDGRLLLRSRDGSAPVDLPLEIETREIGGVEYALDTRLAATTSGRRIAAVDGSRTAFVVDGLTGARLWEARLDTTARAIGLSATGGRVAVARGDKVVQVWDVDTGEPIGRWEHPRPVVDVTFEGGSLLAWLSEVTSTSTTQMRDGTTAGANQSYETTTTTPPAVVAWRLP